MKIKILFCFVQIRRTKNILFPQYGIWLPPAKFTHNSIGHLLIHILQFNSIRNYWNDFTQSYESDYLDDIFQCSHVNKFKCLPLMEIYCFVISVSISFCLIFIPMFRSFFSLILMPFYHFISNLEFLRHFHRNSALNHLIKRHTVC